MRNPFAQGRRLRLILSIAVAIGIGQVVQHALS